MKKITLGKTGIITNNVGFGGIPLQRLTRGEAAAVVRHMIEKGVNYFDSARGYTVSESYIGDAVRDFDRKSLILASKAPPVTYDGFSEQVALSLAALGTDYIDLYQLHNVKSKADIDTAFSRGGAYSAFTELREQGKVLHFGITAHKREVLDYAMEKYGDKIETIMFPYNIVENQGVETFRAAKRLNIATIAMKPLGGGNITDATLAMKYALQNDFIDIAIPGIGSAGEGEQDISFDDVPLTGEQLRMCDEIRRRLGDNFCRRCSYCAPCTAGIDIPGVFTLQNYLDNYDLADWAKARYAAQSKKAGDCVKCGLCETRCPYGLDIMARMEKIKQIFGE